MSADHIHRIIQQHDDGQIDDARAVDMLKRLIEQKDGDERHENLVQKIKHNGLLHRLHLWADVAIGMAALIGIFLPDVFTVFVQADLGFHLLIAGLAFSGIAAERLLHRRWHSGAILH